MKMDISSWKPTLRMAGIRNGRMKRKRMMKMRRHWKARRGERGAVGGKRRRRRALGGRRMGGVGGVRVKRAGEWRGGRREMGES